MSSHYPREEAFLGFCPLRYMDEIRNSVDDCLESTMNKIEASIREEVKTNGTTKVQMTNNVDALHQKWRRILDKNFDKFELYSLRNLLAIPESLIIEGLQNAPVLLTSTEEEEDAIDDDLRLLRERVQEEADLHERNVNVLASMPRDVSVSKLASDVCFAMDNLSERGVLPLSENVFNVLSGAEELDRESKMLIALTSNLKGVETNNGAEQSDTERLEKIFEERQRLIATTSIDDIGLFNSIFA